MAWLDAMAKSKAKKEEKLAFTDALTNLPNRLYFKENYGDAGLFLTMRYKTVAVLDLDGFVEACGREDQDGLILRVAGLIKEHLGAKCEIFHWGEDRFVALMEWSMDFGFEICRELCREVEKDGKVTLSVGITEVRLTETIKKHYHRAMQGCYLVKEMGGNGVKRV